MLNINDINNRFKEVLFFASAKKYNALLYRTRHDARLLDSRKTHIESLEGRLKEAAHYKECQKETIKGLSDRIKELEKWKTPRDPKTGYFTARKKA